MYQSRPQGGSQFQKAVFLKIFIDILFLDYNTIQRNA